MPRHGPDLGNHLGDNVGGERYPLGSADCDGLAQRRLEQRPKLGISAVDSEGLTGQRVDAGERDQADILLPQRHADLCALRSSAPAELARSTAVPWQEPGRTCSLSPAARISRRCRKTVLGSKVIAAKP